MVTITSLFWRPRTRLELLQTGLLTRSGPALVDSITGPLLLHYASIYEA